MSSSNVFVGVHGEVVALDRTTGQELWSTKLAGSHFVNLLVDQDRIIATSKGEVFCLDAATGRILWKNSLPGMGLGLITIATAHGSTSFGALSEKNRQDEAAVTASIVASS
jgi:outer membrane protein assembly factor BamB